MESEEASVGNDQDDNAQATNDQDASGTKSGEHAAKEPISQLFDNIVSSQNVEKDSEAVAVAVNMQRTDKETTEKSGSQISVVEVSRKNEMEDDANLHAEAVAAAVDMEGTDKEKAKMSGSQISNVDLSVKNPVEDDADSHANASTTAVGTVQEDATRSNPPIVKSAEEIAQEHANEQARIASHAQRATA